MSAFIGTGLMFRLLLRRDWVRITVWVLAITAILVPSFGSFGGVFETQESIDVRNSLMDANPAGIVLTGPRYGLDTVTPENLGPMAAHEMFATTFIMVAIMGILLAVRQTRFEEQEGRTELLRAGLVGWFAPATASFLLVSASALAYGVLVGGGLLALGLPPAGSIAFALGAVSVTIVFAALAIVTAQLAEQSRGATGLAMSVFGLLFMVRAFGDMREAWFRWLSPIAWPAEMRPFVDERWWPLALSFALAALLMGAAYWLAGHRDIGSGLLPTRKGRPRASRALATPFGLAMRLQRGATVSWAVGMFIFGAMIGGLAIEAQRMVEALDVFSEYLTVAEGSSLIEAFLIMYLSMGALTIVGQALQGAQVIRSEETKGHAEMVLAGGVSRTRWMLSHVCATMTGTVISLLALGVGAGMTYAAAVEEPEAFGNVVIAVLAYSVAVWIFTAIAAAAFGLAPRFMAFGWAAFAWSLVVGMLGPLLGLPKETLEWTPFAHVPMYPAESLLSEPMLIMGAIVLVLLAAGIWGFRRRDAQFS